MIAALVAFLLGLMAGDAWRRVRVLRRRQRYAAPLEYVPPRKARG